ncbi:hypothetical protein ACP275_10G103800 [Erythranthe tilingii]
MGRQQTWGELLLSPRSPAPGAASLKSSCTTDHERGSPLPASACINAPPLPPTRTTTFMYFTSLIGVIWFFICAPKCDLFLVALALPDGSVCFSISLTKRRPILSSHCLHKRNSRLKSMSLLRKVRDNDLGVLLCKDWVRKHTAKVRQYHVNYQRSSWSKVLGVLKLDNSFSASPNRGSKNLKEKLKLFNSYFEEICKTQSSWVIFNDQLREELRSSIWVALCNAYRNFIARLQSVPDISNNTDRYIRYRVEDIKARISELFQGSGGGRR